MSFSAMPRSDVPTETLENSAFWPDLELTEFMTRYRIPSDHHVDLVREQLCLAMAEINRQLSSWQAEREAEGYASLATVPADEIDGGSALVRLYKRAVHCYAKGQLLTDFASVVRRQEAENLGKEAPERAETFSEWSTQAVRQLQGIGAISVELI